METPDRSTSISSRLVLTHPQQVNFPCTAPVPLTYTRTVNGQRNARPSLLCGADLRISSVFSPDKIFSHHSGFMLISTARTAHTSHGNMEAGRSGKYSRRLPL